MGAAPYMLGYPQTYPQEVVEYDANHPKTEVESCHASRIFVRFRESDRRCPLKRPKPRRESRLWVSFAGHPLKEARGQAA